MKRSRGKYLTDKGKKTIKKPLTTERTIGKKEKTTNQSVVEPPTTEEEESLFQGPVDLLNEKEEDVKGLTVEWEPICVLTAVSEGTWEKRKRREGPEKLPVRKKSQFHRRRLGEGEPSEGKKGKKSAKGCCKKKVRTSAERKKKGIIHRGRQKGNLH